MRKISFQNAEKFGNIYFKLVEARSHTMKLMRRFFFDKETMKKIWFILNETMQHLVSKNEF